MRHTVQSDKNIKENSNVVKTVVFYVHFIIYSMTWNRSLLYVIKWTTTNPKIIINLKSSSCKICFNVGNIKKTEMRKGELLHFIKHFF